MKKADHHPLVRWRFEHGLAIRAAAKIFGIGQSYLSEIENRKKEPTLRLASVIVKKTYGAVKYDDLVLIR